MTIVGVVTPGIVAQTYPGEVFRGIADTCKQYRATLHVSIQNPNRADDLEQLFGGNGCDGVITIVPSVNYERFLDVCRARQCNLVQIDYHTGSLTDEMLTVEVQNYESILNVMDHLFALGHRRIGFITGRMEIASAYQRMEAYQQAFVKAALPFDPAWIQRADWTYNSGFEAAQVLLGVRPRLTAIVTSSDMMATAVMVAARQHGLKVPDDLSVTGFDDTRSVVSTGLTTVRQPLYEMGKVAVELLLRRINGEPITAPHRRLPAELIIRTSTGPAPTDAD